jgi:hypothetical protein
MVDLSANGEATVARWRISGSKALHVVARDDGENTRELACSQVTRAGGSMLCARGVGQ